jgi:hypothetical protein
MGPPPSRPVLTNKGSKKFHPQQLDGCSTTQENSSRRLIEEMCQERARNRNGYIYMPRAFFEALPF